MLGAVRPSPALRAALKVEGNFGGLWNYPSANAAPLYQPS